MSLIRRSVQVVAFICTLIVGAASMIVIVTQTAWFKDWLRGFIVRQAEDYVDGQLTIGRLDGNLFFGVELEDVDITSDGTTVVHIKDVGLDYNFTTFLGGRVVLDDIRLNQPVFRVVRTDEGWNLTHLIKARTPDPDEPRNRRPIEIGEIGISDGSVHFDSMPVGTSGVEVPARIERIDASVGVSSDERELNIRIGHVSLRTDGPSFGVNALSGVIRRTGNTVMLENVSLRTEESSVRVNGTIDRIESGTQTVDLAISSDKFDFPEIARLVPALRGFQLQPAFEMTVAGPVDALAVDMNLREATLGRVSGRLTVDVEAPERRVAGRVSMEGFDLAPLLRRRQDAAPIESNVTGQADIDLLLPQDGLPLRGTYTLRAGYARVNTYEARDVTATGRFDGATVQVDGEASAYGGRATAAGTVRFGQPFDLALEGRATGVDLRQLPPEFPVPDAPSNLQFGYVLTVVDRLFTADLTLESSTLAGATIDAGTTAHFTAGGGTVPMYQASGSFQDLDVQQIGQGFGIQGISSDRYRSRLSGIVSANGSGGGSYPLTLEASGTLGESEIFGATFPLMEVATRFAGGNAQIEAAGQFVNLDPSVVTRNEKLVGQLSGAVDASVTLRDYASGVTPDSIDVTGHTNLGASRFAGFDITRGVVAGTYVDRTGELSLLDVAGPDFTATGKGTIALNDTGSSNLTLHLETPALQRIGTIIGRPLKGSAVVDTLVTGNARALKAEGTLQGSNIGYGEHEALSLRSTFNVMLPELRTEDLSVQASSTATFVEIAGQNINEIVADTVYERSTLTFKGTATQGVRQLAAEGTAVFHPEYQEVRLGNLALRAEQVEWLSVPGAQTTLRYGGNELRLDNLRLANGAQRIEADGVLGSSTETLMIHAENLDVAQLDRLVLGDERLGGSLTADLSLSGPIDALQAGGTFVLLDGSFRNYTFQSFGGMVDYAGRGMNVEVRLQQSETEWLNVAGYAPLSLFTRDAARRATDQTPAPGESISLQISSSQIGLGVIQGFTSYLTNVSGILQVDVAVTGTPLDPRFHGAIDILGGAFSVPDLGTAYTGLDTRIELTEDLATISEMRILDKRQQVMTIGGRLGVHELSLGDLDVIIASENFEVIDNEMAHLNLDTEVRVRGEIRAPRIEGFVELYSSTIDVARVWEQIATGAPAVQPLPAEAADTSFSGLRFWNALDLTIGVAIPNSLILRGTDIRPANAAIDIGDMLVTVGGAVQVRKAPGERLSLVGEVNTVRGSYTFQGRRFDIMRDGRIRFDGSTEEIDPLVDLRARRVISGVETIVRVQGSMRQPELTFTSNPPLDQADILSLIVFNMPLNELGEGQQISLAERAGALAGGYLVSGLTRSIASALSIDEFEIQAQGELGRGPTLTIGEQVGDRLFFRVRQMFGNEQATEFILEYQITDFLRLAGTISEITGGTQRVNFRRIERSGFDLIFFFNY